MKYRMQVCWLRTGRIWGVEARSARDGRRKRVDAFNGFWRGSSLPLGKLVINESLLFLTCPVVASCLSCLCRLDSVWGKMVAQYVPRNFRWQRLHAGQLQASS